MSLLKNALGLLLLSCLTSSCINSKKEESNIIFKFPDPMREGIKKNQVKSAIISFYETLPNGKFNHHFDVTIAYDTLGNIIEDWGFGGHNTYKYDTNGFKTLHYYDGCTLDKYAIFYEKVNENKLLSKWYDLKNRHLDAAIDPTDTFRVYLKDTFVFNSNGYLAKVQKAPQINLTYLYDSQNRLVTIIDSLPRNIPDNYFPVRQEFIYNESGRLTEINEINRVRLITKTKLNFDGLIDSVFHYSYNQQLEKLEVYNYK